MTNSSIRYGVHPDHFKSMTTESIREHFLVDNLFKPGIVQLTYSHFDRMIVGGAMPTGSALSLETFDQLKATHFLERREIGIINVGAPGIVSADGQQHHLDFKEALYVGQGTKSVTFASSSGGQALFYFNSTPAHRNYPAKKVSLAEAEAVEAGAAETSNKRTIRKLLVNSVLPTCQLQMGLTELKAGSIWNTMPPHVHDRRMEVYFYFEVPDNQAVCHFMGRPDETRHVWMSNHQAVISPPWSIHSGAGTGSYTFIWGMAGENLDYGDMEGITVRQLK
jgi:4-deoxy-L-threo-5-hexosulose-uronate ketol-isomerase